MLQFLDFLAKTPQIDKVHDRTDNTAVFEYVSLAVGNFNKIRCSRKFGFVFVRQKLADSFRQPGIKTFIGNSAINNADFDFRRKSRNLGNVFFRKFFGHRSEYPARQRISAQFVNQTAAVVRRADLYDSPDSKFLLPRSVNTEQLAQQDSADAGRNKRNFFGVFHIVKQKINWRTCDSMLHCMEG